MPVQQREALDVRGRDAGDLRHPVDRVLGQPLAQEPLPAERLLAQEGLVVQAAVDDDLHRPQRQRGVGAGPRLDVPVGHHGGAGDARVDHHQLHAPLLRLADERDRVHAGADQVRAPQHDQVGLLHRVVDRRAVGHAVGVDARPHGGVDADRLLQARRLHLVPEALVHGPVVEHAERAGVGIGLHRLGAVLGDDLLQVAGDRVQRLVPADALEAGAGPLGADPPVRVQHPAVVVDQVQVVVDLVAQVAAGDRVGRVALHPHRAPGAVVAGHQHRAGVRAVVGAAHVVQRMPFGNREFGNLRHGADRYGGDGGKGPRATGLYTPRRRGTSRPRPRRPRRSAQSHLLFNRLGRHAAAESGWW